MTAAILAHFGINLGAICFGASPQAELTGGVLSRAFGGSSFDLFSSPDVVHVQTCLSECSTTDSPRRFAAMLASALITYVDLGPFATHGNVQWLVSQTIAFGNETLEIVPKYLGIPGLWKMETRRATKHVNHHFGAREEKWHNHYTVQVHGNDVSAIRKADKSTISFVHLGVTLNTILSIKPHRSWRAKLMREWFKLRPMEDMAPWNFILSSAGSLIYIDGQNFPILV